MTKNGEPKNYDNKQFRGLNAAEMRGADATINMVGLDAEYVAASNDDGYPILSGYAKELSEYPIIAMAQ